MSHDMVDNIIYYRFYDLSYKMLIITIAMSYFLLCCIIIDNRSNLLFMALLKIIIESCLVLYDVCDA